MSHSKARQIMQETLKKHTKTN